MIKPTREELATIRKSAEVACRKEGMTLGVIRVGERFSLAEGTKMEDHSINILQVDPTTDWEESDLFDTHEWKRLRSGIPSDDGRAVVDFYCYNRGMEELITNMQAHFDGGKLVWTGIEGPWGFTHWGTLMEYGVETE